MAPEPPETPGELAPGPVAPMLVEAETEMEAEAEAADEYEGYEPLALGPNEDTDLRMWNSAVMSDSSDDENEMGVEEAETATESNYVPTIETVDREVTRELWLTPREEINIEMNPEKAQEVMSAMANFSLPISSFPEWAHSITEEEWKQQLAKRINISQDNR